MSSKFSVDGEEIFPAVGSTQCEDVFEYERRLNVKKRSPKIKSTEAAGGVALFAFEGAEARLLIYGKLVLFSENTCALK